MFTGIIERTLTVIGLADGPGFKRLTLANPWTDLKPGESIAVNGCCLTVAEFSKSEIAFDVIPQTLSLTNIGFLNHGDNVNVERALRVGDRFDGHFVQGHVDGLAELLEITSEGPCRLKIRAPKHLAKFITPQGSVALDGISLT